MAGFSLIELLVVLAIVGVLAAAGVYYQADRTGPAVKGALVTITSALNEARGIARSTGATIPLVPSGSGADQTLTYQATGGPQGQYLHSASSSTARYSLVDPSGASDPTSSALQSLKDSLKTTTAGGTNIFPETSTVWTTNLFNTASGVSFLPNGSVTTEAYAAVVAARNGVVLTDGPVGIVLVTTSGNFYRYYRATPTSTWTRL